MEKETLTPTLILFVRGKKWDAEDFELVRSFEQSEDLTMSWGSLAKLTVSSFFSSTEFKIPEHCFSKRLKILSIWKKQKFHHQIKVGLSM